ncbi:MAG: glutaredoxin 3 [Deltaproteobacteria bacterium RIFCSPHIGHO2_12_FULL_43_9]|nr:MAG: glutaredoxin 3 [Deltaproteobacteria bacterium RIFCSPHIGHO2_12_FULL_43_9]
MKVKIYTTTYCGYCKRAKELFRSKGIEFEEIDVTNDEGQRKKLVDLTGKRTVPQIFINEKGIGGYDDLALLEESGELDKLLKS